jgi:hypothetical protein
MNATIKNILKAGPVAEESLAIKLFGHCPTIEQYDSMLMVLRQIGKARNMGWNSYRWSLR